MITYHSIQDILELCEKEQMTFAQVIEHADMEERAVTQEASYAKMQSMYETECCRSCQRSKCSTAIFGRD